MYKTNAISLVSTIRPANANEEGEKTNVSELPHLTDDERTSFNRLKLDNWRIGQERLEREWEKGVLSKL